VAKTRSPTLTRLSGQSHPVNKRRQDKGLWVATSLSVVADGLNPFPLQKYPPTMRFS
jgi:hypothetical protein